MAGATTTLYKDASKDMRIWSVTPDYEQERLIIIHGAYGGKLQTKYDAVTTNHSGRNIVEQIDLEAQSRINKKIDSGYRQTLVEAQMAKGKNVMGHPRPMLAKRLDQVKDVEYSHAFAQYKYDGHRCMIRKDYGGGLTAYSRQGKSIDSIDHILDEISLATDIPVGTVLDGELYHHGTKLQDISSWIKKMKPESKQLTYIVYDVVSQQRYENRFEMLKLWFGGIDRKFVMIAGTQRIQDQLGLPKMLDSAMAQGYEGIIVRQNFYPYAEGKRSKGLIKFKKFLDSEFQVKAIRKSKDDWAILVCEDDQGRRVAVSAPGTIEEKKKVLASPAQYVGRSVTVQYAGWTKDNVPMQPVALRWRNDI